jgi:hypothetical protein
VEYKGRGGSGRGSTQNDEALGSPQDGLDKDDGKNSVAFEAEHGLQLEPGKIPGVEEEHPPQKRGRHEKRSFKTRQKRQHWSPYDERGRDDLRGLVASMQKSLSSSESPGHVASDVGTQPKPSNSLPVSPLVQALERKKPTKLSSKGVVKEELANNPWAAMLASPLRLCSATGVRLPKDLLVPWGLVRNPATEEVYFMPTTLAELDSLKDKRRSSKSANSALVKRNTITEEYPSNLEPDSYTSHANADTQADRKRSEMDLSTSHLESNHTEADARLHERLVTSRASEYLSPRPTPSMIYMLPSLPLLHHLTLRFTSLQKDMVTRRSKPNAINSILPWRLKASIDRAKFYAEQRRKISPSSASREAANVPSPNSFQHVKWEVDINEVMLCILRERLLAALDMLGNRNQKLWHQQRELVKAFRVTWTSHGSGEEGSWRVLSGDKHTQPVAEGSEGPDVEGTKICLLVESNGANSSLMQHKIDTKQNQGDEEEATQVSRHASSQVADPFAATGDSWRNYSDLDPPTIKVDQFGSVPLFSLNGLFGPDHASRFRQLSKTIGVLAPRPLAPSDIHGYAYVLVIPAQAFGGTSVIEEVWRLWRFLGGMRW